MNRPTSIKLPSLPTGIASTQDSSNMKSRGRSGSIVKVEEVGDNTLEEVLDRSAYVNINANWVNAKGEQGHGNRLWPWLTVGYIGAWLIHVVLISIGKIIIDTIPGMTPQISWTLVNLCYLAVRLCFMWPPRRLIIPLAFLPDVSLGHRHAI